MAIQILRGSNYIASKGSIELESGQPFYDTATGYLYVGGRGLAGPTGTTEYASATDAIRGAYAVCANKIGYINSSNSISYTGIGSATVPIYITSNGVVAASQSTIGDSSTPVYLNAGRITKVSSISESLVPRKALTITAGPTGSTSYDAQVVFDGSDAKSFDISYGLELNDDGTCNYVVTYSAS